MRVFSILAALSALLLAGTLGAQPAASASFALLNEQLAAGGRTASTLWTLHASVGGDVGIVASSTTYRLDGGFPGAIDVTPSGYPLLTAASPRFGDLLGGSTHTISGKELDLGASTNATVGGVAASVIGRSTGSLTVTLPPQSAPGWKTVSATNAGGTAHLANAIGVRPLLETPWAVGINQPFRVSVQGHAGDLVYLVVARAKLPGPAPVPPFRHALELNLGALIGLIGPLPVLSLTGQLDLDFPAIPFVRPIYVQCFVQSNHPGYAPGSFTNIIEL